jgi:pilus assembly protein CpaE
MRQGSEPERPVTLRVVAEKTNMLRSLIISPDSLLAGQLQNALADAGTVSVARIIDRYSGPVELNRAVRAHAPQAVFVTTESVEQVVAIAAHLEQALPGIQVIAVGPSSNPQMLMALMRGGIREFLTSPFDASMVTECLARVDDNLRRRPVSGQSTDLVYTFLPAKPGVGASTLAVNASLAIARFHPDGALLADFDLNSGVVRFLLNLNTAYTVLDAAEKAAALDENIWSQLVSKIHGLDVLHAGVLNPEIRLQSQQLTQMVDYARRNYKALCIDLSGNLEKYALELMRESRRVFLVTTAEPCSLYLAREKVQYLHRMELGDRVSVLLNRHNKRSGLDTAEVESVVGAPVLLTFTNDYSRVVRAVTEGKAVDPASELGKQHTQLASHMLERKSTFTPQRRRFVEYFSIAPARFLVESGARS